MGVFHQRVAALFSCQISGGGIFDIRNDIWNDFLSETTNQRDLSSRDLFENLTKAKYLGSLREGIAKATDNRCKAMEELLSAIKIVKMYCWESAFLERIIGKDENISQISIVKSSVFLILYKLLEKKKCQE